ncbi:Isoleucine--tRNA ligase [Buchnera aphidicola (Panaphis juglandis)]
MSYKKTLNLPKTKFPMKANLFKKENDILKIWNTDNIYQIIQNKKKKKEKFLLHDGPPYANGKIHIGHAVNKILKDIIIKSQTLSGKNTPYVPFWDCHGLPIENQIEKQFVTIEKNIKKDKFRSLCRKYVNTQFKQQKSDFIRLGVFGDWENSQLTMNPKLEANVIRILGKIIENKYLYQGLKPVHWCTKCQSALAEAEVEYYNQKTESIIVMFKILNHQIINRMFKLPNKNPIYIIIWTTTPWSLPANRAIAVHPELKYQLIQLEKYHIILAKDTVKSVMNKINIQNWKIIQTFYGKNLENIKCMHPFLIFNIPIILSEHVKLDTGTGIVHIAPDHGEDDYIVSKKYNIPLTNIINEKGYYNENICHELKNNTIFNSNEIIIQILKNNKKLLHKNIIEHSYPHCWRHKTPIFYRTTKQWFIKINNSQLKNKAIETIKKIKWIPECSYNYMYNMIKNRPDWCISRQRTWGVPITIFTHKKTGKIHPKTIQIIKKISKLVEDHGSEIWWKINKKEILGDDYKKYHQSRDILDVWFESGCIHHLKLYNTNELKNTSNMYLEGCDQYRGWFMSSLIISEAINKPVPSHTILTHGFIIDNSGKKMSKSIGNVITPDSIINKFGADVLRLWVASTNYTNDITILEDTFKQTSEQYRRIRNTIRFLLSNISDFNLQDNMINFSKMIILDKWILHRTKKIQKKIIELYKNYKFYEIVKILIKFCSIDLGSYYFDIIKDRQYTTQKNSLERRSCQTAMHYILHSLISWITPILPFTTHEIWNHIPNSNNECIFTKKWFNKLNKLPEIEILNYEHWKILFKIKNITNKIIENKIKKQKIENKTKTKIILYAKKELYDIIIILKNELKFFLMVSSACVKEYFLAPKNINNDDSINGLKILITNFIGVKCPRCWNIFNKVKIKNIDHNICNRCNTNVHKNGEKRYFV